MNFFKNNIKKFAVACGLGMASLASFAEGAGSTYDFSKVTTELGSVKDGIEAWMGNAFPIIMGVAGIFLVIWLARIALRALKSLGSAGK